MGAKSRLKPSRMQLLAYGEPGFIGLAGVACGADLTHGRKSGGAHLVVGGHAGDGAALLVHRQKQPQFGIGLGILQHLGDLRRRLDVLGEVDESAHGIL